MFRGYQRSHIDPETGRIAADSIKFPDFSCNWERFSKPEDVRRRTGGLDTDGCYAFTVGTARFKGMATACHDPISGNYAHVEVRVLRSGQSVYDEPPKGQRINSKAKKLEYRKNIVDNLELLIEPTA